MDERRLQTVCLLALAFVAVGACLYLLRDVLVPLVLAIFFSVLLGPLLDLLRRRLGIPVPVALVVSLLIGVGVLGLMGVLVADSVAQLTGSKGQVYQQRAAELVDTVLSWGPLGAFGLDEKLMRAALEEQLRAAALQLANELQSLLADGVLVFLFLVFLVLGHADVPERGLLTEVLGKLKQYLSAKFFLSAMTGVLVGLVLWLLDVDLALVFGLVAFLLNFVPNVGSMVATVAPVPVVLLDPDLSTAARILAIAVPGGLQFAIGNFIEPKLLGKSMDLHPVVVLAALVFWGILWGVVGAILAVPLTATLKILLDRLEVTRPVAAAMAGPKD